MRGRTGRTEAIREAPTAMHVRSVCEACEASGDGIMLRALMGLGTHAPVGGSAGRTQRARAPGRADTARARTHPTPSRARSGRVPSSPRLRAARRARRSGVCLHPLVRRWRDATPATWTERVSRCGGGGGGGRDGQHGDGGGVTTGGPRRWCGRLLVDGSRREHAHTRGAHGVGDVGRGRHDGFERVVVRYEQLDADGRAWGECGDATVVLVVCLRIGALD